MRLVLKYSSGPIRGRSFLAAHASFHTMLHPTGLVRLVLVAVILQTSSLASAFLATPSPILAIRTCTASCNVNSFAGLPLLSSASPSPTWTMALGAGKKTGSGKKEKKSALHKALQKPSGLSVTVSVEFTHKTGKSVLALDILSSQLRKECNVASLWVDREALTDFSKEQNTAKGDFPGPCPVVLREAVSSADDLHFVKNAGASAVVIAASADNASELAEEAAKLSLTVVWAIEDKEQAAAAVQAGASIFLIAADTVMEDEGLLGALPEESIWVAEIAARQPKNMEVDQSRQMKEKGCKAMLVSSACVGAENDSLYSRSIVAAMSSKGSTQFKMAGLNTNRGTYTGAVGKRAGMGTSTPGVDSPLES